LKPNQKEKTRRRSRAQIFRTSKRKTQLSFWLWGPVWRHEFSKIPLQIPRNALAQFHTLFCRLL